MSNIATSAAVYSPAYLAAQPPAVKALMAMPRGTITQAAARVAQATKLAQEGYLIDGTIMVDGWDAFQEVTARLARGEVWSPGGLQEPLGQPGFFALPGEPPTDGQTAYNPKVIPPGALTNSLDLSLLPSLFPAPKGA
jgi:hypothetical protein